MKQNSFFGLLVVGAIALFAMSLLPAIASASPTSETGAAIFVSKQAPAMVSLLVNPDQLKGLEREGELSRLKASLLNEAGIDYRQDIQPWLGNEITLAVTTPDIDRDPENGMQPGYLMALATNKPEKSREFVDLLFSKRTLAGANLTIEEYKGIKLVYDSQAVAEVANKSINQKTKNKKQKLESPIKNQNYLASASVGDKFVLFANDPKVLREAINSVDAPDLNLSSSIQYQKAAEKLPKGAVAEVFLNLPAVAQWQGLKLPEDNYDSQLVSLIPNSKGLLLETSLLSSSDIFTPSEELSKPVGALQYIPGNVGLAISGTNLSNLINSDLAKEGKQITATISGSKRDAISKILQPLIEQEKTWGVNLSEDIFDWVHGEYSIALLPQPEQANPDWVFVVENSEATPEAISHLDAIASSKGLSLTSLSLNKHKIYAWTEIKAIAQETANKDRASFNIEANIKGLHTTLGNYEIFTSSLEAIDQVLKIKGNSLISNRNFQDGIAAIPQPNQGYVYLDWTKSQSLAEEQLPALKLLKVIAKPFFHNLRSLTLSSYGQEAGLLKGGLFFQLQRS
jgi:Protein of unknown function (DUF3352)